MLNEDAYIEEVWLACIPGFEVRWSEVHSGVSVVEILSPGGRVIGRINPDEFPMDSPESLVLLENRVYHLCQQARSTRGVPLETTASSVALGKPSPASGNPVHRHPNP